MVCALAAIHDEPILSKELVSYCHFDYEFQLNQSSITCYTADKDQDRTKVWDTLETHIQAIHFQKNVLCFAHQDLYDPQISIYSLKGQKLISFRHKDLKGTVWSIKMSPHGHLLILADYFWRKDESFSYDGTRLYIFTPQGHRLCTSLSV